MRYISLFSGIEAVSVAWEPLGFIPVAFSEVDPFCNQVLVTRFPHVPNLGDIKLVDWRPYHGNIDIVVGGSPCQAFSVAGKREGLLDERGALMLEYVRAVQEIKPTWCLWENVPGVLSQDGGRAFATLQGELEECGYALAWRVLDAQFFGVAQRRRRVFLIGHPRAECAAAVLFEPKSLCGNTTTSRKAREDLTAAAKAGTRKTSPITTMDRHAVYTVKSEPILMSSGQSFAQILQGICSTQTARQYKDPPILFNQPFSNPDNIVCMANGHSRAEYAYNLGPCLTAHAAIQAPFIGDGLSVRRLMPIECERLQGFPDNWTLVEWKGKPLEECPDVRRYKALGNSMAVPVMRWIGQGIQLVDELSQMGTNHA